MSDKTLYELALFLYYALPLAGVLAICGAIAEWLEKRGRK